MKPEDKLVRGKGSGEALTACKSENFMKGSGTKIKTAPTEAGAEKHQTTIPGTI